MLTMIRDKNRITFPLTPAEIQITTGNEVDTFTTVTGTERSGKATTKLRRVSFTAILPRAWEQLWETGKETIKYKSPEQLFKLLEEWKKKPVLVNFDSLWSCTLKLENMEATYRDGQGNLHVNFSLVEYSPVKIVTYSNTKQLLKPGVVITKSAKSRPNTSGKDSKKNKKKDSKKKKSSKKKKDKDKKDDPNAKGSFDYIGQKNKISSTVSSKK